MSKIAVSTSSEQPEHQGRKLPRFLGIHARPGRIFSIVLVTLPFIFLLVGLSNGSVIFLIPDSCTKLTA